MRPSSSNSGYTGTSSPYATPPQAKASAKATNLLREKCKGLKAEIATMKYKNYVSSEK